MDMAVDRSKEVKEDRTETAMASKFSDKMSESFDSPKQNNNQVRS
jgi:hypothetical protein